MEIVSNKTRYIYLESQSCNHCPYWSVSPDSLIITPILSITFTYLVLTLCQTHEDGFDIIRVFIYYSENSMRCFPIVVCLIQLPFLSFLLKMLPVCSDILHCSPCHVVMWWKLAFIIVCSGVDPHGLRLPG